MLSSLKSHVANYINICANQENQSAESVDSWLDILKLMERTPITYLVYRSESSYLRQIPNGEGGNAMPAISCIIIFSSIGG